MNLGYRLRSGDGRVEELADFAGLVELVQIDEHAVRPVQRLALQAVDGVGVADFGEGRLDGVDDDFALGVLLVVVGDLVLLQRAVLSR